MISCSLACFASPSIETTVVRTARGKHVRIGTFYPCFWSRLPGPARPYLPYLLRHISRCLFDARVVAAYSACFGSCQVCNTPGGRKLPPSLSPHPWPIPSPFDGSRNASTNRGELAPQRDYMRIRFQRISKPSSGLATFDRGHAGNCCIFSISPSSVCLSMHLSSLSPSL